jgi:hypothetical protein
MVLFHYNLFGGGGVWKASKIMLLKQHTAVVSKLSKSDM